MTFATESGYSLPGSDEPLTHARVLHKGNRFRARTVTASAELAAYPASAVDNALTYEKWRPFQNVLSNNRNFAGAAWTLTGLSVGSDGITVTEDSATSTHGAQQSYTFASAAEHVVGVRVQLNGGRFQVAIIVNDGTTTFSTVADLSDQTTTDSGGVGDVFDLGDGEFLVRMYFTPAAAAGSVQVALYDDSGTASYAGDGTSGMIWHRIDMHLSEATLRIDTYGDKVGTMFAIAGHNLGTAQGRITFQHDANDDDTFTSIDNLSPSDDQPIMFLFNQITSSRWRVVIDRALVPEIAVIRVGDPLQFQRARHNGFTPIETNRRTIMRGNQSEGGEWLGRSKVRVSNPGELAWQRLTPAWVEANLDGPNGMIRALEDEPFFLAWRPDTYAQAHYCWTEGPVDAPTFDQRPNLMSFSIDFDALGFE